MPRYDFAVDKWYLLPVTALRNQLNLQIRADKKEGGRFWDFVEAWDLLRSTGPAPDIAPRLTAPEKPQDSAPQTAPEGAPPLSRSSATEPALSESKGPGFYKLPSGTSR